jgi:hypothetical protein
MISRYTEEVQSSDWILELKYRTLYQEARYCDIVFQQPKSGEVTQ